MSFIGDLGNPDKDAAALNPVVQQAIGTIMDQLVAKIVPALKDASINVLDGLTITTTFTKNKA